MAIFNSQLLVYEKAIIPKRMALTDQPCQVLPAVAGQLDDFTAMEAMMSSTWGTTEAIRRVDTSEPVWEIPSSFAKWKYPTVSSVL